jgi:hypothetical protein
VSRSTGKSAIPVGVPAWDGCRMAGARSSFNNAGRVRDCHGPGGADHPALPSAEHQSMISAMPSCANCQAAQEML